MYIYMKLLKIIKIINIIFVVWWVEGFSKDVDRIVNSFSSVGWFVCGNLWLLRKVLGLSFSYLFRLGILFNL